MGLDLNGTKFLIYAKEMGIDYKLTALIGRQELHLSPEELFNNFSYFGYKISQSQIDLLITNYGDHAENFLEYLGAEKINSFDFSDYEEATHIHDMNLPIPDDFKNRYSVVVESGSLEHIFNFPVGIKNCMQMIKPGGHFLGIIPAHNFLDHGFYQFCPEIFLRVFSEENGFEVVNIFLIERGPKKTWYSVVDTRIVNKSVTLATGNGAYISIIAKKNDDRTIFQSYPAQNHYKNLWNSSSAANVVQKNREIEHLQKTSAFKNLIRKHISFPLFKFLNKRELLPGLQDNPLSFIPYDLKSKD